MSYTSKTDMTSRFGARELEQLTDRDGTAGAIVDLVLDHAIATADAEINGYLAKRYALPLATVPSQLQTWAADIARYHLHTFTMPEIVRNRYDAAIASLRQVATGKHSLGDETAADSAPASPGVVATDGPERIFDRTSLKGW